jgi:hypothetical protein
MMSGRTSEKPLTSNLIRTDRIVGNLKRLSDGWGGAMTKKPTVKAVRRLKKILAAIEAGHMPFPVVTAVANGGIVLTWSSIMRDILMTVDTDGDIQFITSLKRLDRETFEVIERTDSEGAVTDIKTIDHMMAWFCLDKAHGA